MPFWLKNIALLVNLKGCAFNWNLYLFGLIISFYIYFWLLTNIHQQNIISLRNNKEYDQRSQQQTMISMNFDITNWLAETASAEINEIGDLFLLFFLFSKYEVFFYSLYFFFNYTYSTVMECMCTMEIPPILFSSFSNVNWFFVMPLTCVCVERERENRGVEFCSSRLIGSNSPFQLEQTLPS